jgi:hypothetical protein
MNAYFFATTNEERSNILDQHKKIYDGLQTMQSQMKNPMDLYVQDFANDKEGITVNSKGDVKKYTNTKIHEQLDIPYPTVDGIEVEMTEGSEMCEQCGVGTMLEGECNECGYKEVKGIGGASDFDYVGEEDNFDIDVDMDEEIKESVTTERNTIMEMFQRMSIVK